MFSFGDCLKDLRERAELTQQQLADKAGLQANSIARLERGEREPSWATVQSLAKALGVSCEAFTQPPTTTREPSGPGRPAKAPPPEEPPQKKPRGRPKKQPEGE